MEKKIISLEELSKLSRSELLSKINDENVSLLKTLGADALYDEMKKAGAFSRFLVRFAYKKADKEGTRKRTSRFLKFIAPSTILRPYVQSEHCIVIGFNHPSLGEILRLIYNGFDCYEGRDFLFPVNIPWYETLVPVIPILEETGIRITPIITPSTEAKLNKMFEGDAEKLARVQQCKIAFERVYMKTAKECADHNDIIVVAPSATRQADVFADEIARRGEGHIHPTMTLLAHRICSDEDSNVTFLPVTIFEPQPNDRMFNLFKNYGIYPCDPFSGKEAFELSSGHNRDLDYQFLKRIDEVYSLREK